MYAEGRVVSRDLALAVTMWRQAAEAGYGPAQLNLAVALEGGVGVERNQQEAALWYERAKDRGLTSARTGPVEPAREDSSGGGGEPSQRTRHPVANTVGEAPGRPPAKAPLTAPSASAPFYVQLASLRSQEGAARFGHDLATRHADLLAGLEPSVRTVDLAGKGVWHRVLFGPISSRDGAMRICAGVRARAGDCLVLPPQPLADVGPSRRFGEPTPPR